MVQEDQIHSTMNKILKFIMDNARMLSSVLGAFLVVLLAIYLWNDYRSGREQERQTAFSRALEKFHAPVGEAPAEDPNNPSLAVLRYRTEEEKYKDASGAFAALSTQTKGSAIFPYSRYYEGLCRLELGKTDEFISIMEQLSQTEGNAEIRSLAIFSLAESYLAVGNVEKATEHYEKILKDSKTDLPRDEILYSLAEYHLNKKEKEKAIDLWKRLIKEFPESKAKSRAENQLSQLGEKTG